MEHNNKRLIALQFKVNVYEKTGIEFQGFFSKIMEQAFAGFISIRPYGKDGDGGNDGYIPGEGSYYQVYSPRAGAGKDGEAAEKFEEDFNKLKSVWDEIVNIKTYNFVFNDKYGGSITKLEACRAKLERENENIKFKIFRAVDLEKIFLTLNNDQLASIGIETDPSKSIDIASDQLEKIKDELDRGNAEFVLKTISNIKELIQTAGDDELSLEYTILEAQALQKLEKVEDAISIYEGAITAHPSDPRALLFLAEVFLNEENYDKNEELIAKAEKIDAGHWLFKLEKIIRELRINPPVNPDLFVESEFPENARQKANFYRLYAISIDQAKDIVRAKQLIDNSIELNPNKFSGYDVKLSLLVEEILLKKSLDQDSKKEESAFFSELRKIEDLFSEWRGLSPRTRSFLNIKHLRVLLYQNNLHQIKTLAKETFDLLLNCHFDYPIDRIMADLLGNIGLLEMDVERLLGYLKKSDKNISDDLAKSLILQFIQSEALFNIGKEFLTEIGKKDYVDFLDKIEKKEYDAVVALVKDDLHFAVRLVVMAQPSFLELREKILAALPDDGQVKKEKLELLVHADSDDADGAFDLLKEMNMADLSYVECIPIIKILEEKQAWDLLIPALEKVLEHEEDLQQKLQIELKLFTAHFRSDSFKEVIKIGNEIFNNEGKIDLINSENKELLLAQTLYAYSKRGEFVDAEKFLDKNLKYFHTYEAKISIVPEIYIRNKKPDKAIEAIVDAVTELKRPTPEDYANLFIYFIHIGNQINFQPISMEKVEEDSFVKLKDKDLWYFVGDGESLDATSANKIKNDLLNKSPGDTVVVKSQFQSRENKYEIEMVLKLDKYILWKSIHSADKLAAEGILENVQSIEVKQGEEGLDTKYLVEFLKAQEEKGKNFFETYTHQTLPLSMLAVNEGGLTNAIGKLGAEGKGFINFSDGTPQELEKQKAIARTLIAGKPFVIDGTSALILAETGMLKRIHDFTPNIIVPQSVISLLLETKEKFRTISGQMGHMAFVKGRPVLSPLNEEKRKIAEQNFGDSIDILESNSDKLRLISNAIKSEVFSEQKIPASLSDGCILAKKENVPILTEDFLHLRLNELETKNKPPEYCSSLVLVKCLYEGGKISFEEYLDFFSYLSGYRFRFLPITVKDLEKAVFGDNIIKDVKPEALRRFNFSLTLSEEYGVKRDVAIALVGNFLIKQLLDDAIPPTIVRDIFIEIIDEFPEKNKREFANTLLTGCVGAIQRKYMRFIPGTHIQEKIDLIQEIIPSFYDDNLIT